MPEQPSLISISRQLQEMLELQREERREHREFLARLLSIKGLDPHFRQIVEEIYAENTKCFGELEAEFDKIDQRAPNREV
jgi:hypothetical protein